MVSGEVSSYHVNLPHCLFGHVALTGIAVAFGRITDSRCSETPPEPCEESAKAEQPRPITTVTMTHSSFDEQNLPFGEPNMPKPKPERVDVGSVFSPAPPWTVRTRVCHEQAGCA